MAADAPVTVNKYEEKGDVWVHLAICLHPALPSPPSSPSEPVAKSEKEEEEGEKERERDLAVLVPPFPHPPSTCRDDGHPGALAVGEVLCHRL